MIGVVVLISGNGSNLQQIIDKCHNKTVQIHAVISDQFEAYGLQRATDAGIPAITLRQMPEDTREYYCDGLAKLLKVFNPRFVILAGFMKILTPNFVNKFDIMNIHPALLPKYPGLNTHQRALDAGDELHGITIHWVDEGVDTGPIIHQAQCAIHENDTAVTLQERVHKLEHFWYPKIINYHAIMASATDKLY